MMLNETTRRFNLTDHERAFTPGRVAGHWNTTAWRRSSPELQDRRATIPRSQIRDHVRNSEAYQRIARARGQDASVIANRTSFLERVLAEIPGNPTFADLERLYGPIE